MKVATILENYSDENGNKIVFNKKIEQSINIRFTGRNNTLIVSDDATPADLLINFDCDNGLCEIGRTRGKFNLRIGQDSKVVIGDDVSTTQRCYISAAEGSSVRIGKDCMISVGASIRTDDSHAIFDVESGLRVNHSKDVVIGDHVWIGQEVAILGGSSIGDGSIIGFRSVVKGSILNNCIAVGIPSRVVRKNVAWERPHLTLTKPYYKPDSSCVRKSGYWNLTHDVTDETLICTSQDVILDDALATSSTLNTSNSINDIGSRHSSDDVVIRLAADLVQLTDMLVGSLNTFAKNGGTSTLISVRDQLAQAIASHKQAQVGCDDSQKD